MFEVFPPPAPRAWPEGRGHRHPPHPKATEVTLRRDTERCLEPPSRSGTPCSRAGGFGLLGGQNGPARTDLPRTGPQVSPELLPTPGARRPPPHSATGPGWSRIHRSRDPSPKFHQNTRGASPLAFGIGTKSTFGEFFLLLASVRSGCHRSLNHFKKKIIIIKGWEEILGLPEVAERGEGWGKEGRQGEGEPKGRSCAGRARGGGSEQQARG